MQSIQWFCKKIDFAGYGLHRDRPPAWELGIFRDNMTIFIFKFKFWVFFSVWVYLGVCSACDGEFSHGAFPIGFRVRKCFEMKKRKNFSVGAKYKLYFPIQIKRVHADEKNAAKKRSQALENQKITKNRKYKGIHQRTRIIILSHRFFFHRCPWNF